MITIKSTKANFGAIVPTSLNELSKEILEQLVENIKLPKHYAIVCMCFKTSLFDFIAVAKNPKETSVMVIPLLAKISDEDKELINAEVGDKIIIDRTSLERGSHLHVPTIISSNNLRNYIFNDNILTKAILSKNVSSGELDDNTKFVIKQGSDIPIYVVEFKIVAASDIRASLAVESNINDPWIETCYPKSNTTKAE